MVTKWVRYQVATQVRDKAATWVGIGGVTSTELGGGGGSNQEGRGKPDPVGGKWQKG